MKTFLAGLIGVVGGVTLSILYRKYNSIDKKGDKILLYDASPKKDRKCSCQHQYCTCGRHII